MNGSTVKKMVIAAVFTVAVSAVSFAEIIIAPVLGYGHNNWQLTEESRIGSSLNYKIETSQNVPSFILGFDMMLAGRKTGLSVFFNNMVSFAFPKGVFYYNKEENRLLNKVSVYKGPRGDVNNLILFDTSILLGHRFKFGSKAIVAVGIGLGFGLGGANYGKNVSFSLNVGTSMHVTFDYMFTKTIGLHVAVTDTIGRELSNVLVPVNAWVNRFQVKVGPAFKF